MPLSEYINTALEALISSYGDTFEKISEGFLQVIILLEQSLTRPHWSITASILAALTYLIRRRLRYPVFVLVSLAIIAYLELWTKAMQTLALMLTATSLTIVIGLPLGILSASYRYFRQISLPILDAMQTMPSFVYLVPALMLFGLGKVPAVFATMIYTLPPLIRLTDLGLRLVNKEVVEASMAFGASRRELLLGIQLPLALPTIMAGINQTIMLSLSMVVIASMIGARGLGEEVLLGIQRLDVGRGLIAGMAIVLLAMVLDRMTHLQTADHTPGSGGQEK